MFLSASIDAKSDKHINVSVKDKNLSLELAETFEERNKGLMFRKSLCQDCGMIFKFESPRVVNFWMKNTFIPLDIAYINERGQILAIEALQPLSEISVPSPDYVLYAWEMNQNWFNNNNIEVGDQVEIKVPKVNLPQ